MGQVLWIVPGDSLSRSEGDDSAVAVRIVIALPEQAVEAINRSLHHFFHLGIREVGDLRPASTRRARPAGVQGLKWSVAKCQDH